MSYQIGLDTVYLRPTPRLGHTEYCSNAALKRHLGVSAGACAAPGTASGNAGAIPPSGKPVSFEDAFECDLIWSVDDGPVPWGERGRVTDMGHADFLEGGTDRRLPKPCPFTDVEEVLAFDAVKEYGLPSMDGLVRSLEQRWRKACAEFPEQMVTGGYYKTVVSGAIEAFGWDLLLEAAADQDRFEKVLDSFFRLTLHHTHAWAKVPAPVYIQHDDFV